MATPITTIYARAARKIGGITGTISSPGATSVVLDSLIGTTGDSSAYAADLLWFLASNAGSRERIITTWADSTGTATIPTVSDVPTAGETFILNPRENYTLGETDEAFYKACRDTWRTYRQVIPVTPYFRLQVANIMTWLQGGGRIDAVFRSDSPLMLHNEDFSLWQNGPNSAPDGYTVAGTLPSIVRVDGGVRSLYAAQLTAGGGGLARITQAIPASLSQWLTRRTFPIFIPLRAAAWLSTQNASAVRVFIRYVETSSGSPVTTYAYSSYATGTGLPEFPSLSLTPTATMNSFEWGVEIAAGATATISFAGLMQNTLDFNSAYQIKDAGSQFYSEYQVNDVVRNVGGQPVVEFQNYPATWGQAIIYSRRPFPTLDPYADSVEDQYAEILEAGLLVYLLQAQKPGQDRGRLDRVLAEMTSIWNRRASNTTDLPVPRPPVQARVGGA